MKQIYNNIYKENVLNAFDITTMSNDIETLWNKQHNEIIETLSINQSFGKRNFVLTTSNQYKQQKLNQLYSYFVNRCNDIFKHYTIAKDNRNDVWVYCSDKMYSETGKHDHKDTATLNGVFYLKTVKGCGIKFYNPNEIYEEPVFGDLYIFPGDMAHDPVVSKDELRISLNVELKCNESITDLFDPKNLLKKKN